jgi:inner membrane protease subunit 1
MASIFRSSPTLGHPFRLLFSTVKYFAALHLFWEYGYSLGPAQGPSMLPTVEVADEWMLTSKRHRHGRGVEVGDLVVYKIPIFPDADGMKRVLGMPGDYVMIDSPESGSDAMIQVSFGHRGCDVLSYVYLSEC